MERLRTGGKIRFFGVSNFDIPLLEKALQIASSPVLTDQVECHPYLTQRELLRYCQEKRVILTAYSPLARGRLLGDPVLEWIGKKYGKSVNQVALRWLIQQEMVVAIPKAQSATHQKENLDIFDFRLTPEEMEEIGRLDRGEKVASRL
jgi:diketogulonate reductase-like aldo/keto reductase